MKPALSLFLLLAVLPAAHAKSPFAGGTLTFGDWEAACDNTGRCQIAGYQSDEDTMPFSIRFTRHAGAKAAVSAHLALVDSSLDEELPATLENGAGTLFLNGKSLGEVRFANLAEENSARLSHAQTQALVTAFAARKPLVIKAAGKTWLLSDETFRNKTWEEKGEISLSGAYWLDGSPNGRDADYGNTDTLKHQTVRIFSASGQLLAEAKTDRYADAVLPEADRAKIQAALPHQNTVELRSGAHSVWRLSDNGAWAALYFADRLQGRTRTRSALAEKGGSLKRIPAPHPLPVIRANPPNTNTRKKPHSTAACCG